MDFLSSSSSSMLGQFYPQEEDEIFQILNCNPPTQLQPHDHDQINPTQNHDHDLELELDHLLLQIQDPHHELLDTHNTNNNNNHEQRRKASSLLGLDDDDDNHESKKDKTTTNDKKKRQKTIHREIERQRRLEMTSLHANLRSLLPLDFVKGKRSTSDHLDMTVKYIKHMQEKIQGLSDKRDALTKLEVPNKPKIGHKVIVNNCQGGVEIIFSTSNWCVSGDDQDQLLLSKMLLCLTKQGLDVISCISNRINNKLVHSIQAQVGDGRSFAIDAKELQQKLANV